MRKCLLFAIMSIAFATTTISGSIGIKANAQERTLRIYNWSDYIDPQILEDFTSSTGIEIVYDVYDNNDILETKLLAGNTGYDLVVPTAYFLARQLQAGVFEQLSRDKIPNWGELDPALMARAATYDPGNAHGFIYLWGTTAFAFNEEAISQRMPDAPTSSWRMLLDPSVVSRFADCGVYMLDAADEAIPTALNYLGLDPNSTVPEELERAAGVLKEVRPYVRKFHSSENINALANDDICLAQIYSGDAGIAAARAEEAGNGVMLRYVIPEEGAQLWFDMLAMPKDAPHKENAYAFMNYILQPQVIARSTNFVTYPNAVPASLEYVEADLRNDPNVYPPEQVRQRLYTKTPYDLRTQRIVTRLWQQITTGG